MEAAEDRASRDLAVLAFEDWRNPGFFRASVRGRRSCVSPGKNGDTGIPKGELDKQETRVLGSRPPAQLSHHLLD